MYTMNSIYGSRKDDVWWAASDLGWVVGHSYIAYGPLLLGKLSIIEMHSYNFCFPDERMHKSYV